MQEVPWRRADFFSRGIPSYFISSLPYPEVFVPEYTGGDTAFTDRCIPFTLESKCTCFDLTASER